MQSGGAVCMFIVCAVLAVVTATQIIPHSRGPPPPRKRAIMVVVGLNCGGPPVGRSRLRLAAPRLRRCKDVVVVDVGFLPLSEHTHCYVHHPCCSAISCSATSCWRLSR
jgi:hypothetical protein